MRLEKWALIAEIIGGVAIVVTLIVLILEVRGNTEELRAATLSDISARTQEMALLVVRNPSLAEAVIRRNTGSELTALDRLLLSQSLVARLKLVEESFIAWREGRLADDIWQTRVVYGLNGLRTAVNREIWRDLRTNRGFLEEFSDWFDAAARETYAEDTDVDMLSTSGVE